METGEEFNTVPPTEELPLEAAPVEDGQIVQSDPAPQAPEEDLSYKIKGLEAGLSSEREKRRILEDKARYLEEIAFQRPQAPAEPEYDGDDFPTFQAVDKLVEKRLGAIQENMRQQQVIQMEEAAKSKYNDFEDVVSNFTKEIVNENPDLYNVIMNSKNPADTAYRLGRTHPKYLEKLQQSTAQTIAKKIDSNVNATPTLSALGGVSTGRLQEGYYSSLPKDDFEKIIADVMSKP